MKSMLGFLIGALVGAAVALLLAPSSGEELRTNIKSRANEEYVKLQEEFQKGMQEIHARMDKMGGDMKDTASQAEETVS